MNATARETIKFRKKTEKKRLNKRVVEALALPPANAEGRPTQAWYYDDKTPRLAVCVWTTGAKSWYWIGRVDNGTRMIRHKLGEFPEMSPEQARKSAEATSTKVGGGIDPQKEKRNVREEFTLQDAFDRYLAEHAKKHKRTWKDDEDQFRRYCDTIKNRKLSSIDAGAIASLHTRVGEEHGKYSANRVLAMLSKLFAFCKMPVSRVGYRGDNPCKGIKKFGEEQRDRYMDADELKRFFEALNEEVVLFQDFFKLLLWTGARRSNVQAMRYDEINYGARTWRIPDTKNKKPLMVPLGDEAMAILLRRQAESNGNEWVFQGGKRNQRTHLQSPKTAWKRICKRAGLLNLRMHDLRRTLGSWQAATGASLPIIGKTLGHANQATTQIYARLTLDPVRAAVDTAVDAMMNAANGDKKGEQQ